MLPGCSIVLRPSVHVSDLTKGPLMTIVMTMVTVSKSILKAKMLELFRRIEQTGEELVVTSNGVPVLKVVPYRPPLSIEEVFGDLAGHVEYHADILEPTTDEWSEV